MVELYQSTINKYRTRFTNYMAFATELNVLATFGDNTRWSDKKDIFSLFTGELGVTSMVNNTRMTNKPSQKGR